MLLYYAMLPAACIIRGAGYPKELPLLLFFSVQGYFHFPRLRLSVSFFRKNYRNAFLLCPWIDAVSSMESTAFCFRYSPTWNPLSITNSSKSTFKRSKSSNSSLGSLQLFLQLFIVRFYNCTTSDSIQGCQLFFEIFRSQVNALLQTFICSIIRRTINQARIL